MRKAAILLPLRRKRVLLAKKRTGRHAGLYTGYGGKVDGRESVTAALVREMREEAVMEVSARDMFPSAIVTTYEEGEPRFELHIFTTWSWKGEPRDTAEMYDARWFPFRKLPLTQMRQGDSAWLPKVLDGDRFKADVHVDIDGLHSMSFTHISRYHPYQSFEELI